MTRFSMPVRFSSTAAYWPARPIRWRRRASSATTSSPATRACPPSGLSRVASTRTKVVLPAPLGPSRPSTVPAATSSETPSRARTAPNDLRRSRTLMAASVAGEAPTSTMVPGSVMRPTVRIGLRSGRGGRAAGNLRPEGPAAPAPHPRRHADTGQTPRAARRAARPPHRRRGGGGRRAARIPHGATGAPRHPPRRRPADGHVHAGQPAGATRVRGAVDRAADARRLRRHATPPTPIRSLPRCCASWPPAGGRCSGSAATAPTAAGSPPRGSSPAAGWRTPSRPTGCRWPGRWRAQSGAQYLLGLDLEANNPKLLAGEVARMSAIGAKNIAAFEIGNEPEVYGTNTWYVAHGRPFPGRPRSYELRRLPARVHPLRPPGSHVATRWPVPRSARCAGCATPRRSSPPIPGCATPPSTSTRCTTACARRPARPPPPSPTYLAPRASTQATAALAPVIAAAHAHHAAVPPR